MSTGLAVAVTGLGPNPASMKTSFNSQTEKTHLLSVCLNMAVGNPAQGPPKPLERVRVLVTFYQKSQYES